MMIFKMLQTYIIRSNLNLRGKEARLVLKRVKNLLVPPGIRKDAMHERHKKDISFTIQEILSRDFLAKIFRRGKNQLGVFENPQVLRMCLVPCYSRSFF